MKFVHYLPFSHNNWGNWWWPSFTMFVLCEEKLNMEIVFYAHLKGKEEISVYSEVCSLFGYCDNICTLFEGGEQY